MSKLLLMFALVILTIFDSVSSSDSRFDQFHSELIKNHEKLQKSKQDSSTHNNPLPAVRPLTSDVNRNIHPVNEGAALQGNSAGFGAKQIQREIEEINQRLKEAGSNPAVVAELSPTISELAIKR